MSQDEIETEELPVYGTVKFNDYDAWLAWQVRLTLPRWVPGTRASGYSDGYAHWPTDSEEMAARLEHLAGLNAHA